MKRNGWSLRAGRVLFLAGLLLPLQASRDQYRPLLDGSQVSSVPFQEGEELRYEVNWKPLFFFPAFKAGEVTLQIEEVEFWQRPAYRISAWAISDGLLSRVAGVEVRNYFESTVDRRDFRSYRMLTQTRQNREKKDLELTFDYEQDQILVREVDLAADPPRKIRDEVIRGIPGPLVDVLSVFYAARLRTFQPSDRYTLYLNDKGKVQEVRILAEKREKVDTPIGEYPAVKLTTVGGLFSGGGDFRIWYSRDPLRVPVKFEAEVKFGKVYGKLIRLSTPRMSRGILRVR